MAKCFGAIQSEIFACARRRRVFPFLIDDASFLVATAASDPFVAALNRNLARSSGKTARLWTAKKEVFCFSTPLAIPPAMAQAG